MRIKLCITEEACATSSVGKQKKEVFFENMSEKNFAVVFRMFPAKWKRVEDFLDNIGATLIFVKQADVNRKLVVKNLPEWQDEKENGRKSN